MTINVSRNYACLRETSIDYSDPYYCITFEDCIKQSFDYKIGSSESTKIILEYQACLINKLDQLPSSELQSFISYHMNLVADKLEWLRGLDKLINHKRLEPESELFGNAKILNTLIPDMIMEIKNMENIKSEPFEKIKTSLNIKEMGIFCNLLCETGIISEEKVKRKLSRIITANFDSKDGGNSADSLLNHFYSKHNNSYNSLRVRLESLLDQLDKQQLEMLNKPK